MTNTHFTVSKGKSMCFPLLVLSHPKRPTCQLWSILLSERGRSHWNWVTATGMSQCGCRSQLLRFSIPWMLMFFPRLPNFCRRLTTLVKQNNEYGHQMARGPSPLFDPVDMGEDLVVTRGINGKALNPVKLNRV